MNEEEIRQDERDKIRRRLLKKIENSFNMEEVVDIIKHL